MYTITLAFGMTPATWRLVFKTKESAEKAWALTAFEIITITDDYGQSVEIDKHNVIAKMMENVIESNQAMIALSLNHQKVQVAVQKAVESDPQLRIARGPAVLQPMGGMPNGRFS